MRLVELVEIINSKKLNNRSANRCELIVRFFGDFFLHGTFGVYLPAVESFGGRAFVLRVRSTSWLNFQGTEIVFGRKNTVSEPWGMALRL